ncbi:protein PROCA1 isoform X2 [Echinops telfairi]|uniref:Protein PROCA1 isoform X2 n=1 Tax=Echinops telfairi TaxID=9371 RepID=A0ABM0ISV9_ECHTE|nr:protein PROCA1 isoform X2 [Echinops telfairi]
MWVRTTLRIERWTREVPGRETNDWEESQSRDINRLPNWERRHLDSGGSSTEESTCSSEADLQENDRCHWNHTQCARHILHPLVSDYGHHQLHLHAVSHCDCDSRGKDCSEKANSSSSSSQDVGPACFKIIQTPCYELIPEEECVERFWYSWCKSYRPVSVAVIHHPVHHEYVGDELHEDEEEAGQPPIPTQVGPTKPPSPNQVGPTKPPDTSTGTVTGLPTGAPDSAAPITIWRSESPTGKNQGSKVTKKVKKKKEKEKEKEESSSDREKTKLKKKVTKGKVTKKKSPLKSEPSPPDSARSASPRELTVMSESSPDSREDLESEESNTEPRQERPSSEESAPASSPRKREKPSPTKKPARKLSPAKKVTKKKSPPTSNPNLS